MAGGKKAQKNQKDNLNQKNQKDRLSQKNPDNLCQKKAEGPDPAAAAEAAAANTGVPSWYQGPPELDPNTGVPSWYMGTPESYVAYTDHRTMYERYGNPLRR